MQYCLSPSQKAKKKSVKAEAEHRKAIKAEAEKLGFKYVKGYGFWNRNISESVFSDDAFFDLYKIENAEKLLVGILKMINENANDIGIMKGRFLERESIKQKYQASQELKSILGCQSV